jgi:N-acetyltransferase
MTIAIAKAPWIAPVVMEGRVVRLEPLEPRHAADLHAVADPELFRFTPQMPAEWSVAGFEHEISKVCALIDVVAFAIIHVESGRAIGRTTFMDIRAPHRGLEIGRTWIGRAFQGTRVNPEIKFLMLRHAFEGLWPPAVRAQLCTGGNNLHSQRAIAKLGAVREGELRHFRIVPSGPEPTSPLMLRSTVVFSILAEEWPKVREGLVARMGWSDR